MSLRRRTTMLMTPQTPDFTGYNLTRFYATFKSNIATLNNMAEMTRGGSIGTPVNIPYNGVDPDYSGIVAVDGTVDWYASKILCQLTGHAINGDVSLNDADQWCKMWDGATQANTIKNGKPSFKFKQGLLSIGNEAKGMQGLYIPELDAGKSFSVVSVVSNETVDIFSSVVCSSILNENNFLAYIDSSSGYRNALIKSNGTSFQARNLLQYNTRDTKIQIITVNVDTNIMKSYLDGVFQTETTFTEKHINDALRFGARADNHGQLTGHLQTFGVAPVVWDGSGVYSINRELKKQFELL